MFPKNFSVGRVIDVVVCVCLCLWCGHLNFTFSHIEFQQQQQQHDDDDEKKNSSNDVCGS